MSIIIRKGVKEDMKSVLELNEELAHYQGYPNDQVITEEDLIRDGAFEATDSTQHPLFYSFFAEVEESELNEKQIIGYAVAHSTYSDCIGKNLRLYNLFVKESYRGKGVGKKLFKEVVRFAHDTNCKRFDFEVLDRNPAIKFYEQLNAVNVTKRDGWQILRIKIDAINNVLRGD